jgi:GMP synthase (glutamine-hydrolysing)
MTKVLVVEHEAQCPPAWMGEWLEAAGATLDVHRPYDGQTLPDNLDEYAGWVILGGTMGANDDAAYPWLTDVKRLVRLAAETHVPTLGICLGHQLCAVALGGEVRRNPRGQQIGVLDVGWTGDAGGDPLFADLASDRVRAVQWNDDLVVARPPGCVVLAETPAGELQAARFAPTVWGVQWHPEAGAEVVRPWADNDRDRVKERGVDVEEYVAAVAAAREELRAAWSRLADGFMGRVREAAHAAGAAR